MGPTVLSDLFFYGTLRHVPLLELVLGRGGGDLNVSNASLAEHAVYSVKDQSFPMIVPETDAVAEGVLVQGMSDEDLKRLAYYEGGFDYDLQPQTVTTADGHSHAAQVFFPAPGAWSLGDLWSLSDWVETWGELTVLAAEEVMGYFGTFDADWIARSFPAIRWRAWARMEAKKRGQVDERVAVDDVKLLTCKRAYVDFFGFETVQVQHRQFDGSMGPVLNRGSLMLGEAVIVLPYDPVRDTVLLVEQFRTPVYLADDPEPWMWEPVAGIIDPLETPEQAAHRETLEEAHMRLDRLERAGGAYTSSGSSTEFIHLYVGLGNLLHTTDEGGVAAEGEDIRTKIFPFDAFLQMVDAGKFKDMPLLMLAHWLARHRKRLRA